jgi:hypothetical protein
MAAKKIPQYKLTREDLVVKKNFLDVTNLIRSIQRAEGNPDCFGKAKGYCDGLDCAWHEYCLEEPQNESKAHENEQTVVHGNENGDRN